VAAVTTQVSFGPLVARIGLVPDEVLVAELASLAHMAPGRLIAGMGTGDAKSAAENEAYGIPPGPADERRLALRRCARRVLDLGVPVWIGGGSVATTQMVFDLGPGCAVNLWAGQPAAVAGLAGRCEVTWGGPVAGEVPEIALQLSGLAEAGATWAVCAWPESLDALAEVAQLLRRA
jgi:alkanesulfonate monooxygenase SsuD/methylene tetrahydromethanopterin reductase-like flavin-dependent oxidoreductase (luciferase family)